METRHGGGGASRRGRNADKDRGKQTRTETRQVKDDGPSTSRRAAQKATKMEQRHKHAEILKNGIMYLTCTTGSKIPIKKADFVKRVFENDKSLSTVQSELKKMKHILKNVRAYHIHITKVFGLKIVAYNDSTGEFSTDIVAQQAGFTLWFVVSEVNGISRIIDRVMKKENPSRKIEEAKQAILVMLLTIIFMQNAEVGVDESQLWSTVRAMGFDETLDLVEKDFKKFLKTEYLAPMYLKTQEHTNEQEGVTVTKYAWGPRATLEFSKWALFKHAIKQFPHSKPGDFPAQLQFILNSDEKVLAKKEMKSWEIYANDTDSSNDSSDNDEENGSNENSSGQEPQNHEEKSDSDTGESSDADE